MYSFFVSTEYFRRKNRKFYSFIFHIIHLLQKKVKRFTLVFQEWRILPAFSQKKTPPLSKGRRSLSVMLFRGGLSKLKC